MMAQCPPWMNTVNTAPWNSSTTQTNYPRTISIRRLKTVAGTTDAVGAVGYSGAEQDPNDIQGEVILYDNVPATIQLGASGRTNKGTELPGDAISRPVWNILIPATALPRYAVRDRDIILDDEGYRYEVGANYWTPLGYQLSTVREEA